MKRIDKLIFWMIIVYTENFADLYTRTMKDNTILISTDLSDMYRTIPDIHALNLFTMGDSIEFHIMFFNKISKHISYFTDSIGINIVDSLIQKEHWCSQV